MNYKKIILYSFFTVSIFISLRANPWGLSKDGKEQKHLQEGNRLLRENKYYEASLEFEKAGRSAIPLLNNIKYNYNDLCEAQKAAAVAPEDFRANYKLAVAYHNRFALYKTKKNPLSGKFFKLAVEQYQKAAGLQGASDFDVMIGQGGLYFTAEDYSSAIGFYEKASNLKPEDAESLYSLSACYRYLGQNNESAKYALRCITLNTDAGKCYFLLGLLAQKRGDNKSATNYYYNAMRYNPEVIKTVKAEELPLGYLYLKLTPLRLRCEPTNIEVYAYHTALDKKIRIIDEASLEEEKSVAMPIGSYKLHASFIGVCVGNKDNKLWSMNTERTKEQTDVKILFNQKLGIEILMGVEIDDKLKKTGNILKIKKLK